MDWLGMGTRFVADLIDKLPFEKMIVKPRDTTKDREELKEILQGTPLMKPNATSPAPYSEHAPIENRKPLNSGPTTQETVDYQNREIGKLLLRMERHLAQRFQVNGKACDCGQSKHLLDLESLCEESVSMVTHPAIYYRIIEWVRDVGPKASEEAVTSGAYDQQYPEMAHQARDFRKELLGSLDTAALWPKRLGPVETPVAPQELQLPPGETLEPSVPVIPES
jgi:hypothetical protein